MKPLIFDNIKIASLAACVPAYTQQIVIRDSDSPKKAAYKKNFLCQIGVHKHHISITGQTSSDTGYAAATAALNHLQINASELDGVIFLTQTPDICNGCGNAFILHNRLKMKKDAFAFDIRWL